MIVTVYIERTNKYAPRNMLKEKEKYKIYYRTKPNAFLTNRWRRPASITIRE